MPDAPLLRDLLVVAAVGVVATLLVARLRLPSVAGLLAAGAVAGPHALGLVEDQEALAHLADVGVVLLLFTIGLEFNVQRLLRIGRLVSLGGTLQVGLTVLATFVVTTLAGRSWQQGVFLGFLVSLSSTAVVLRELTERREIDAPHGRFLVGVLVFQDLAVIPMALLVPVLAGSAAGDLTGALLLALGKSVLVVAAASVVARYVLPRVLAWVDATHSREVFLLAVLGLAVGTAWGAVHAGLSPALGAFLAGLMLAATPYGGRALADVRSLETLLVSVFFVSLGMLFDVGEVAAEPLLVTGLLGLILVGKGALASLAALGMRFPPKVAVLAGVGLAQVGEFSFVLATMGISAGLVTHADLAPFAAAGVASLFVTPLLIRLAPHFTAGERILAPLARLLGARSAVTLAEGASRPANHVVVVGYGVAGRLLARALKDAGQPYLVLEMKADTVLKARAAGETIYYGDVTSSETLADVRVADARALVLLINDPEAARRAVAAVRSVRPDVPILIRSRYLADRPVLQGVGATDVVLEEVEAGAEMIARLLRRLGVPGNRIADRLREARAAVEQTPTETSLPPRRLGETSDLQDLKVETILLEAGHHAAGKTLAQLLLRTMTGALAVARRHEGVLVENPDPHEPLAPGDTLFLVGSPAQIRRGLSWVQTGSLPPE